MVTVKGNLAEFIFFRPQATQVHLVGDFNHWHSYQVPMIRMDDGHWVARLSLPEGTYKFRYCADGEWFTDYAAFGVEFGPFGPDSLLRVEAAPAVREQRSVESELLVNMPPAPSLPAVVPGKPGKQKVA